MVVSLSEIGKKIWRGITDPIPSPAACSDNVKVTEAPNLTQEDIRLSVGDLDAILNMGKGDQVPNECHVSLMGTKDGITDFGSDYTTSFWSAAAHYIIEVKYGSPIKQGYIASVDDNIRTALAALPLNAQREEVINKLAAKLKENNPDFAKFIESNNLKYDSENMRVWCNAPRKAGVPVPKSLNVNLTKKALLDLINGVNNICIDKDKPAPDTFRILVSSYWKACQSQKDAIRKYLAEQNICAVSIGKTEPKYEIASVDPATGAQGKQVILTIKPKAAPASQPGTASQPAKTYFLTSDDLNTLSVKFFSGKTEDKKVTVVEKDAKNPNPIVLNQDGDLVLVVNIDRNADVGKRNVIIKIREKEFKLDNGFEVKKVEWGKGLDCSKPENKCKPACTPDPMARMKLGCPR